MKRIFKGFRLILTLDCEHSARITSESFERKLFWYERCAVRLHNAFCLRSRRLEKQIKLLHQFVIRNRDRLDLDDLEIHLPPESRARIRQRLSESGNDSTS